MTRKTHLLIAVGVLIGTGFLITSLASFFVSRASLRHEIAGKTLPLTSDNIYSEIHQDLLRPVFISSLMASDTFLRDWIIQGETDSKKVIKYLKEIKFRYNTFTSFLVSEKTRTYYHFDGILKTVSKEEPRDRWYFRVRDMSEEYEINVDPDLANKDAMTIFINYRIYDYDNTYIGATGVGLTVNAVSRLIESYQEKYNRTIYFIDQNGEVMLAGSHFDSEIKNISQLAYASKLEKDLGTHFEQVFSYKKNGQTIHSNIRYIDQLKWHLVVEQPENETIREIYKTLLNNLVICLGVLLFILFLVNKTINRYRERIETLSGIVPICSYCKQIRDDKGYWNRVEAYIGRHTDATFSHGICPDCIKKHHPDQYGSAQKKRNRS